MPSERKIHFKPTAYTGGLALCFIYIVSTYVFNFSSQKLDLILSISLLIAITGFVDDKYNLNIGSKLSLQIIPVFYLIILENFHLNDIGDYNYFKLELNSFSVPFTLLSIGFLINAFNYFDGFDKNELFFTNPTSKTIKFSIENKNYELKPNYSLLVEIKDSIISINSNCLFFRPTIFSYKNKYLDVHHS